MPMNVQPYIDSLVRYVEERDYRGYDPYDALNSPLLARLGSTGKWARIAFTQLFRRSPLNLRPLAGVKPGHNPKGVGLFLWGYSKLYKATRDPGYLEKIEHLISLLERLNCTGYSGSCWGYNFDWQSRTFFRKKRTPTIVNTSFIGHALLDCYEITGNRNALDLAIPIKDFILDDLYRTKLDDTFCFSYTPVDTAVVHNANMLGASILIRLKRYCDDDRLEKAALSAMDYSMRHQRGDGSWYYAETSTQKWIDSFHTGFNLQAIRYFMDEGYADAYTDAYEKGVGYYRDNFFLNDGTPKYYHNRTYPIDIHAPAEAIVFFSGRRDDYALTENILSWMLAHMYDPGGYFYFRKTKLFTNRLSYMRWSQAWAFHALTEYYINTVESDSDDA